VGAIELERLRTTQADFERRFSDARGALVATCRGLVGDEAEDVVHDTYLRAASRLNQLHDWASLEAWLAAMAVNECYQRHRRRRRLTELLSGFKPTAAPESDPDLRALVEALPHRERTVVVLHYGHGLTLEEVAGLLAEKPSTIPSVLFRARA
jgi:RNA polymerase sigma-70 factor (ECF subfamily)